MGQAHTTSHAPRSRAVVSPRFMAVGVLGTAHWFPPLCSRSYAAFPEVVSNKLLDGPDDSWTKGSSTAAGSGAMLPDEAGCDVDESRRVVSLELSDGVGTSPVICAT